jgi:DNA-binding NtrC family response regulator
VAFADRFHAARPDAPVVLMTAFLTHAVEAQVAVRPFLTVLSKPLDYNEFHTLLHELISSSPLAIP